MNLRILLGCISVLSTFALLAGATYAFFSDVSASTNNIFSVGSLNMKLSDANETALESVTGTFGLLNGLPGATFTGILKIKNTGTVAAHHIELKFSNTLAEGTDQGVIATVPLDQVIEITSMGWDSGGDGIASEVNLVALMTDVNGNGIKDLDDLENQTADDFDDLLFGGTQTSDHSFVMSGRLSPTLTVNQHQGDQLTLNIDLTMNQDASQ